eukprot:UN15963
MGMATAFFETFMMYVLPPKVINVLFPPYILGIAIILIGFSLVGVGVNDWNGNGSRTDLAIGFWSFSSMVMIYRFGNAFLRNISVLLSLISGVYFCAYFGCSHR